MANVRIKDLTTTAATTASDDFFGVDGATNGTRKLNAFSPTFGGNLILGGTKLQLIAGANPYIQNGTTLGYLQLNDDGTVKLASSASNKTITLANGPVAMDGNLTVSGSANALGGTNTGNSEVLALRGSGTTAQLRIAGAGADYVKYLALGFNTTSNYGWIDANQAGVGVKPLVVNPSGGNFLIGTTTDVGPRLLSKAKDNTYAGAGIGIVDQSAGTSYITRANGTFYISNNGSTDHFALDASGNATFAGNLTVSGTGTSSVAGSFDVTGPIRHVGAGGGIVGIFSSSTVGIINSVGGGGLVIRGRSGTNNDVTISNSDGSVTLLSNLTVSGGTISSGTATLTLKSTSNTVVLQSAGTTALTLDASQNATFAGKAYINGATASSALDARISTGTTNDTVAASSLSAISTGTATDGFGGRLNFLAKDLAGNESGMASIRWAVKNTGYSNREGELSLWTFSNGVAYRQLTLSPGTGAAGTSTFVGPIAIGNTVNTVSPTSPNRTITMVIGGTTYYIHAKTTND